MSVDSVKIGISDWLPEMLVVYAGKSLINYQCWFFIIIIIF